MEKDLKAYDLEERLAKFGEKTIKFVRKVKVDHVNRPLIAQLVRCSTSIGANYMEANGSESRKDFMHKASICKKEARETKHFIRMLVVSNPEVGSEARFLWKEAHELTCIFGAITKKRF